jgi:sn-glycerol 3-phosphate transport system permease protein
METLQIRRRLRNYLPKLPMDLLKIALMLAFVFPFYWMVITSFKPYIESIQTPPTLWPVNFTLENYAVIFSSNINVWQYAQNTVVVTLAVIALQLAVMIPAAYGFAKRNFPLKGLLFSVVLVAFMIPGQITYITTYLLFSKARMINSLWPQILPFGANAFGIFMLRQAFKQLPDEIVESARLDGAGEGKIMFQIMLPMCKSSIITIAMFSFVDTWNSYFWPLVMTNSEKYRPLTMYVEKIRDVEQGLDWSLIMAANCLLVVPVLIVFIFASKKIIQAFAYNGMK